MQAVIQMVEVRRALEAEVAALAAQRRSPEQLRDIRLAMAALDVESDISDVKLESGMEELKRRLEKLLGERPAAPIDQSRKIQIENQNEQLVERRDRVP